MTVNTFDVTEHICVAHNLKFASGKSFFNFDSFFFFSNIKERTHFEPTGSEAQYEMHLAVSLDCHD